MLLSPHPSLNTQKSLHSFGSAWFSSCEASSASSWAVQRFLGLISTFFVRELAAGLVPVERVGYRGGRRSPETEEPLQKCHPLLAWLDSSPRPPARGSCRWFLRPDLFAVGGLPTPGCPAFVLRRADKDQATGRRGRRSFLYTPCCKLGTSQNTKSARVGLSCAWSSVQVYAHSRCPIRSVRVYAQERDQNWQASRPLLCFFFFIPSTTFTVLLLGNSYLIHSPLLLGKVSGGKKKKAKILKSLGWMNGALQENWA